MYKTFVAFRYLRRNWLNVVGVCAVAVGVLVPTCVLSVMKGFDEELRRRIRGPLADLVVESPYEGAFSGYEELMARIERLRTSSDASAGAWRAFGRPFWRTG